MFCYYYSLTPSVTTTFLCYDSIVIYLQDLRLHVFICSQEALLIIRCIICSIISGYHLFILLKDNLDISTLRLCAFICSQEGMNYASVCFFIRECFGIFACDLLHFFWTQKSWSFSQYDARCEFVLKNSWYVSAYVYLFT